MYAEGQTRGRDEEVRGGVDVAGMLGVGGGDMLVADTESSRRTPSPEFETAPEAGCDS